MPVDVTTRNVTRNQSTADFSVKRFCIFDNRFVPGIFTNGSGASYDLVPGTLILRDTSKTNGFKAAVSGTTLADVIGISVNEGTITLADAGTANINIVTSGTIDGTQLTFPGGVTLETVVGTKTVKDILNALGLHIDQSTVENTNFDN